MEKKKRRGKRERGGKVCACDTTLRTELLVGMDGFGRTGKCPNNMEKKNGGKGERGRESEERERRERERECVCV
jgi:hypothetical protein